MRLMHAFGKMLALGARDKIYKAKVLYLGQKLSMIVQSKKEKAAKSLMINRLKKGGCILGAKLIWKVQSSVFMRNMKQGLAELSKNRLIALVHELSHENEQAQ